MLRRPVKRLRSGRYELRLSPDDRQILRELSRQLDELLAETDDPSLKRLFPPAYVDDPKKESEYRELVGADLVQGRRAALDTMAATIDLVELDEAQISAWLSSINDLRLVIGTQLDVSEDEPRPDTPLGFIYEYLGYLEEAVVDALASQYDSGD